MPGYEIRDEVAAAKSAARSLVASLLKLEKLFKTFPHHPFFGDIGGNLESIISTSRRYRRAAGEESPDQVERKLARVQELEQKAQSQAITIKALRGENEEVRRENEMLRGKLDGFEQEFKRLTAKVKEVEKAWEQEQKAAAER
jgi:predicted RNase H-like nuclease (RuvC/YqgF family)